MRAFRLPVLAGAVVAALLLLAAVIVFNSSFQTWAVARALARPPGSPLTIARVDAGWKQVRLSGVRYAADGLVVTAPQVEADVSLWSLWWDDRLAIARLVASGWTVQVGSEPVRTAGAARPAGSGPSVPLATAYATGAAVRAFTGVFTRIGLPLDVALDGVQLSGEVLVPAQQGRATVSLKGGGLAVGREGRFDIVAEAAVQDPHVSKVSVQGTLVGVMDSPRTFSRLAADLVALAQGTQFPQGVTLKSSVAAQRTPAGENYAATVAGTRELVRINAEFPRGGARLEGSWNLDLRDTDVAPFVLGSALPVFSATGEGRLETDAAFASIRAVGRLSATADRLEAIDARLRPIGALTLTTAFDLAQQQGSVQVRNLEANVAGLQQLLAVRALQGFEFSPQSGSVRASDPERDLVQLSAAALPVDWLQPFLTGFSLSGGTFRGELIVRARGDGLTFRSRTPLAADRVSLRQGPQVWVRDADLTFSLAGDVTPRGWQADVSSFSMQTGGAPVLLLDVKAGQLAGPAQPLKAAGKVSAQLPALVRQLRGAEAAAVTAGDATIEFVASMDGKTALQANVAVKGVAATVEGKSLAFPSLAADLRADVDADGAMAVNAPVRLERDGRKSDLTLIGTIGAPTNSVRAIDARVTSEQLVLDDASLLGALLSSGAPPPKPGTPRGAAAPWAGWQGAIALQLKRVIYSDAFEVSNVTGRLRLDGEAVRLETVQGGVGEGGRLGLDGTLTFDAVAAQAFGLDANLTLREFDPAPALRALDPGLPATLEGRFDVTSKVKARASGIEQLFPAATGEFRLTSRAGVFRGLQVNATNLAENTSKLAAWISSAGTAIGALTGRKDYADVASKAQALSELAKGLSEIPFDQLSVSIARDGSLNTRLENFTLISPELRLNGSGEARHQPGTDVLQDALTMQFTLRARGRHGDLLRYLGALDAQVDDLGYAACTVPLKVGGTLGRPDTTELNNALTSLALEKAGVTEKASELLNRLLGAGK